MFRFVDVTVSWKELTPSVQMLAMNNSSDGAHKHRLKNEVVGLFSRDIGTFTQPLRTHTALAGVGTLSLELELGPCFFFFFKDNVLYIQLLFTVSSVGLV